MQARWVRCLLVVVLLVGGVQAVQLTVAHHGSPARADVSTGTAGVFVSAQGRIVSTLDGTGGYSAPFTANAWNPVQVDGLVGVPSSGVSAVQVTVTAVSPATSGTVSLSPDLVAPSGGTSLVYGTGVAGSVSNTAIVAVGSDGKIKIRASTSINALIDVQGYYTGGANTAAGGFAPVPQVRFANTLNGTDMPLARVAAGSTINVPLGGLAGSGVPVDANAAFVNVQVINYGSNAGYLTPFPHGSSKPASDGESFPVGSSGGVSSSIGTTVPLGPDGSFDLFVGGTSVSVDLLIDVQGYFDGTVSGGGFTPAGARVLDTRISPNTAIAANSTTSYQVTGIRGVPVVGSGISALSANIQVINTSSGSGGYLRAWASDQAEPSGTANLVYAPSSVRSNLLAVQVGNDGRIKVHNVAGFAVDLVIDVQGWYSTVTTPISNGQTRTQQSVTLQAGSAGGSWVTYKYRAGTTATFSPVPSADVSGNPTWPVTRSGSPATFAPYTWNVAATLATAAGVTNPPDTLVQVVACYGSSSTDPSPVCSVPSNVQYARNAFSDSYASDQIGPGSVSLLTGDYELSAGDVSVATYQGALSIGRTFTTLSPAGERTDTSGIFGPGWAASLPGPDAGAGQLAVADNSSSGGYLNFTDTDGGVATYQMTSPATTYPVSFAGVGDAAADGSVVTKPNASEIDMTDTDGTTTKWLLASGVWGVATVSESGLASTTSYTRDAAGRVTRILGAVPAGVTCASPDTTPGCRSLTLTYGTVTVAGVSVGRLLSVIFHTYDPVAAAMTSVVVASYDYDSTGRLFHAWDPRISPNLKTTYTYDGNGRLATLTPPGLVPWSFGYDSNGKLSTVSRYDSALAQTATSTLVYNFPVTGSGAPIDFGPAATAAWGQTSDVPIYAAAVFSADHLPASTDPALVSSSDWPYADLHYLDVNGRETNTVSYGAGAWQYGATTYDAAGNTIADLTPGNRVQALATTADTDPAVAALTGTAARAGLLSSLSVYDPLNPDRLIDSYGPAHPVVLISGSTIDGRAHQHTSYDEGSPLDANGNPGVFGLPTTLTSSAWDLAAGTDDDTVTTRTGYSAVSSTSGSSLTGWDLRLATSRSLVGAGTSGGDLVTSTRYNDAGQTTQSWLPASSDADAKSTSTSYYTATGTGGCVSAPLAGLVCSTGPTAQPSSGSPLPVTTTSYNLYDQPLTVTETVGSTVRTTAATYDAAGRVTGSAVVVTPTAAGGTALPAVTTSYKPDTGLPITVTAGGKTLTTGYNDLGRVTTYTDATGNTATTSYDLDGRAVTVNDGKGSTTFTYDSATEHRSLVTAENLGVGSALGTFTASYNADGGIAAQTYPSGLVAATRYDNTADPTSLVYAKAGTTWMSFTQTSNAQGQTATQTSPQSSQVFSYDPAGRLNRTQDTFGSACTTRVYTLDGDSNRTALNSYPAGAGGACSTSTTPTTTTSSYDGADRITNTGYSYDTLGRISTVPATDAQGIGSHASTTGAVTVGYYSSDLVASQTQGSRTLGFTLDPMQTRFVDTTDTAGTTSTNHYADISDSPAWTNTGTAWTRNLTGITGGLAATQDQAGTVILQLANLHGDIVATAADTTTATAISSYSESTEYGAPRTAAVAPDSYGWLGTKRRSTNDLGGLTLMGVRLYNPTTARFLSVDPVPGGSDNPYVYVNDPSDQTDLDGNCWHWCRHASGWGWGGVSVFSARAYIDAGWSAAHGRWGSAAHSLAGGSVGAGYSAFGNAGSFGFHRSAWGGGWRRALSRGMGRFGLRGAAGLMARSAAWPITAVATFLDYAHSNLQRNNRQENLWRRHPMQTTSRWSE